MEEIIMPKSLTAENAKSVMRGEFFFHYNSWCKKCWGEGCKACDGRGYHQMKSEIPWTTIKEIYALAVEKFGKQIG